MTCHFIVLAVMCQARAFFKPFLNRYFKDLLFVIYGSLTILQSKRVRSKN